MLKMNQLRNMSEVEILQALEGGVEIDFDVAQPLELTATYKLYKDLLYENSRLLKNQKFLKITSPFLVFILNAKQMKGCPQIRDWEHSIDKNVDNILKFHLGLPISSYNLTDVAQIMRLNAFKQHLSCDIYRVYSGAEGPYHVGEILCLVEAAHLRPELSGVAARVIHQAWNYPEVRGIIGKLFLRGETHRILCDMVHQAQNRRVPPNSRVESPVAEIYEY